MRSEERAFISAGAYCSAESTVTPMPCDAGYYCPEGTATPIACPPGTINAPGDDPAGCVMPLVRILTTGPGGADQYEEFVVAVHERLTLTSPPQSRAPSE